MLEGLPVMAQTPFWRLRQASYSSEQVLKISRRRASLALADFCFASGVSGFFRGTRFGFFCFRGGAMVLPPDG